MFENDITKCLNTACKIRFSCLRYCVKDSVLQSYALFQYKEHKDGSYSCDHHINFNKYEIKKAKKQVGEKKTKGSKTKASSKNDKRKVHSSKR